MKLPESWLPENTGAAGGSVESPDAVPVNQKHPIGMAWEIAHDVKVSGISQPAAAQNAALMIKGANPRIRLVREIDNREDPTAIAVIGTWEDSFGIEQHGKIGYLPRDVARSVYRKLPAGPLAATIRVISRPRDDRSAGLRISVWANWGAK